MTVKEAELAAASALEAVLKAAMQVGATQGTPQYGMALALAKKAREAHKDAIEELLAAERTAGRLSVANKFEVTLAGVPSSMAAPGGFSAQSLYREFMRTIGEIRATGR